MTILRKDILQTFVPGQAGSPADPGQPYLPARTIYTSEVVCAWEPFNANAPRGNVGTGPGAGYPTYVYVCRTVPHYVNVPAQNYIPATPAQPPRQAQFQRDFQLGWNGRANGVMRLVGNGVFGFKARAGNIGAVVGLSAAPSETGFSDILFGFYLSNGIARVYESGSEVDYIGGFDATDSFKIQRTGGKINYLVNGTQVYQSDAPVGPLFATACLYSGGDEISDAELVGEAAFSGSLLPLDAHWGDTAYTGMICVGRLQALTGSFSVGTRFDGALPAMAGIWSDHAYARFEGRSLAPTGFFEGLAEAPPYAIFSGAAGYLSSNASILNGTVMRCEGTLTPPIGLFYDRDYGDFRGALAPVTGYWSTLLPANEAFVFSGSTVDAPLSSQVDLFVVMNSSATALGLIATQTLLDDAVYSEAEAGFALTADQVISALLTSVARLHSLQFDDAGDVVTWAMNVVTAGTTRYENYSFNSFAKIGEKHFGARADGIYELTGPDDNGTAVPAHINLGNNDFGTSLQKALKDCYVGVASNGKIVVKVIANGETYIYTARDSDEIMKTQRVDFGRGFRATFFELEIHNSADGGAMDLATIEFTPAPLTRRI